MDAQTVADWLLTQPPYVRAIMAWTAGMIALAVLVGISRWIAQRPPFPSVKGAVRRSYDCRVGRHEWAYPLKIERRCRRCQRIEMKVAGRWEERPTYTYSESHR